MAKDLMPIPSPNRGGRQLAKINALWDVLLTSGEELSALMPSMLDSIKGRVMKGNL